MPSRYRVTASTGSWRSLPWPYGIFEIAETTLTVRSWHWSWWVSDRVISREEIETITAVRRLGVLMVRITTHGGQLVKIKLMTSRDRAVGDLRRFGYLSA
jgi:hypothetical protein